MPLLFGNTASAGAGGVPAGVTTENLLFYVDAGVPQSYPGTGSTWFDLSGNNLHLALNNTTYVSSGAASYFNFDGVQNSSRATVEGNSLLDFNNTFSTSITVFGNAGMGNSSTDYHDMYSFGYDNGGSTFQASVWRSGLYPGRLYGQAGGQISFGSGGYLVASPEVLLTSTFNHLTWTFSPTEQKLYRNGTLLGTYANSGTYPTGGSRGIWVGGKSGGNRPWWGSFYTAAIWKGKTLTQTEVTNSWNAIKARYGF
jgi:hypothetical protein